jgi:tRNA 2-selenouridine synthase SelU
MICQADIHIILMGDISFLVRHPLMHRKKEQNIGTNYKRGNEFNNILKGYENTEFKIEKWYLE